MMRLAGFVALATVLLVRMASGQPTPPNGLSNWAFDELTLVNGAKFQGLILSEMSDGIRFQSVVSRSPGRPTVTLTSFFAKTELAAIKRLSDDDRKLLTKRLAELDPNGEGERQRMESLEIVVTDWAGKPGGGRRYESEYFTLQSSGSEELTRRSAVRLEQIYTAFSRFLPPTTKDIYPTRIMLATNKEEYISLLGPLHETLNSAVFDPQTKSILCWSDLKRLGTELQTARLHHSQQLASLKQYEERVSKLYKKDELERFLAPINLERQRVWTADAANGKKFDQATARIFAILYHEAFHAYVGTFIYPPLKSDDVKAGKGTGELPRWLNEGLAQVFETAVVEAGELRADSPNRDRLLRVKDWLKGKGKSDADRLVPLNDLLTTGKDAFLAFHADEKTATDRAYLTSWALAYYMTFD
ncbi:MAG TPA: DUF1570 domain-containing protein, partial [Gemmata sp.]|nr:DUF1570 domain-containing protein [Gemmata sp.]